MLCRHGTATANPELLTSLGDLPSARTAATARSSSTCGRRKISPRATSRARCTSISWGVSLDRHRSGAAQGVHVDDRSPLQPARRRRDRRRWSSTTISRGCAPRARSGSSNTSAIRACRCSTAASARGSRAGLPVTREAAPPRKSTWTGTPQERTIATWRDVKARLGSPDVVILDTRSDAGAQRHAWCARSAAARSPAPSTSSGRRNLGPDGAFKPAAELRAMYQAAGVTPDKEVVTYCQGGYRAAHAYLACAARLCSVQLHRSWKDGGREVPIEPAVGAEGVLSAAGDRACRSEARARAEYDSTGTISTSARITPHLSTLAP